MVMLMMNMDSIRNILMKLWDTFIYMNMMCKYVISNEDTVRSPTLTCGYFLFVSLFFYGF